MQQMIKSLHLNYNFNHWFLNDINDYLQIINMKAKKKQQLHSKLKRFCDGLSRRQTDCRSKSLSIYKHKKLSA